MSDNDNTSNRDAAAKAPLIIDSGVSATAPIRPPQPERPDLFASEHIPHPPAAELLKLLPAGTLLSDI